MDITSYLKPENSIVAGLAVVALVIANYNLHGGTVAQASMTEANSTHMQTSTKKAGYTSLLMVAGIALISRDANVFILGSAAIIAMHSSYLHAIAVNPATGTLVPAGGTAAPLYAAA
jgi:hypothetical protein